MHDITAIVYTVRQIAAGRNYNRVEVFRTSRVASMLPCSSCVYTYNYDNMFVNALYSYNIN